MKNAELFDMNSRRRERLCSRRGTDGGVFRGGVPLYFAFYRFADVMESYPRNGLRVSKLGASGLKNGPPASASARIFSERLFFGKSGPRKLQTPSTRLR